VREQNVLDPKGASSVATEVGIRELLEAGVHFGHQTRRWNPKMRRFIHGERGGIYIIDLLKTHELLHEAQQFASAVAHRGGTVLFVGTKKQARDTVREVAERAGMPYVNHRWLGGLLTNFQTMSLRTRRLHDLERYESEGQLALLPTRERLAAQADLEKLRANLGGVKDMQRVPDAVFIIDLKTEAIAVREAQRLRIPIIGLVDTNCDPDGVDYVIPGNDDAIRSCALISQAIGDVVAEGFELFRQEEARARREAEERSRREEEERARRESEALAAAEAAQRAAEEGTTSPEAEAAAAGAQANAEQVAARQAATADQGFRHRQDAAATAAQGTVGEALGTAGGASADRAGVGGGEAPGTAGESVAAGTTAEGPVPQAAEQGTGQEEVDRQEALVHADGGGDRQAAEREVAEAVAAGGRPKPDPAVAPQANTSVAEPQRDNVKGTSPDPAPSVDDEFAPDPDSPPADRSVADAEPQQETGGANSGVAVDETIEKP
jgi:small subunit ribosomal protein S2